MAETIQKIQSGVGQMKDKAEGMVHDVSETVRDNRWLSFVGIGLLAAGAGFGIWSLIKSMRGSSFEGIEGGDEGNYYGHDDFKRSSQY